MTASFTEALHDVFVQRGLNSSDPYDVMRWIDEVLHQPADLGRAGLAEEVAAVVVFLASRRNGYTTGANDATSTAARTSSDVPVHVPKLIAV